MDTVSPGPSSDSASDRTAVPIRHNPPADATGNGGFDEETVESRNRAASNINGGEKAHITVGPDILALGIEVVVITLLNRGRIHLMMRDRTGARQCFEHALQCSKSSSDEMLQLKCGDWMKKFESLQWDHQRPLRSVLSSNVAPLASAKLATPSGARPGLPNIHILLDLITQGAQIPDSLLRESAGRSNIPLPFPSAPAAQPEFPPTASQTKDSARKSEMVPDWTPESALMPSSALKISLEELDKQAMDMDRLNAEIMNAPARSRLELNPIIIGPSTGVTDSAIRPDRKFELGRMSPDGIKVFQASTLMAKRRLKQRRSSQTQQPPLSPTHEKPRSLSGDENVSTISPLPQRRPSLIYGHGGPADNDDTDTLLSTDTPSLSKLAETMKINSSPKSDSSVETAILQRPPRSPSHSPSSLTVQTSGPKFSAVRPLHSTVPLHHSPLREAFVPEPDSVNDGAASAGPSTVSFTDPLASDTILYEEHRSDYQNLQQSREKLVEHDQAVEPEASHTEDATASITRPDLQPHETMTDEDLHDAEGHLSTMLQSLVQPRAAQRNSIALTQHQIERQGAVTEVTPKKQAREIQPLTPSQSQLGTFFAAAGIAPVWDLDSKGQESKEHGETALSQDETEGKGVFLTGSPESIGTRARPGHLRRNPQFEMKRKVLHRRLHGGSSSSQGSSRIPIRSPKSPPKARPESKTSQGSNAASSWEAGDAPEKDLSPSSTAQPASIEELKQRHVREQARLKKIHKYQSEHPEELHPLMPMSVVEQSHQPRAWREMEQRQEREVKEFEGKEKA